MKKWSLYFLFLFFLVNVCNNNKNKFVDNCVDYEFEVYQSILYSIGFMRDYRPVSPPSPLEGTKDLFSLKERKNFELELAEFNSKIDTVKKYVFISDTLRMYNDLIELGNNIGYFYQIDNCSNIIEQLCDSIDKFSLIPVNTNMIIDGSTFYDKFGFKEDGLYSGILTISKILFNDDYTEGCLLYSFVCGSKCAIEMLLIVVKREDKWEIKKEIFLSAS